MKKIKSAASQCICFVTAVVVMVFVFTGSAYAVRDHQDVKNGRSDFRHNNGASVVRNHNQGQEDRHSPRYEPRHKPDYRPSVHHHRPSVHHHRPPVHHHRPPVYHHRPPVYHHRPPVHYHRPPVYHHRPPVYHHRYHNPRVHIGLGANFFWPWFGYYSGWESGSVFVSPSVGTVFVSLPLGYSSINVGGTVYYHNDGIYYKEVPSGYVVTEPPVVQNIPVVTPPLSGEADQVSVTTQVLNVRSGPGFDYPVILQVVQGDSLTVRGEKEGWLYVQTAGGESGWVVSRFTTRWSG
ncbi:MAG: SH3 domain-containing protein [Desulfococcaceae bacterium]